MTNYAIFCPECDTLVRAAPACPACGWRRPRDEGPLGQLLGEPLALSVGREPFGRAVVAGQRLWLAARQGARADLLALELDGPAIETIPLPDGALPSGLAGDGRRVFVPLESREHGPAQPLLALEGDSGGQVWRFEPGDALLSPPAVEGGQVALTGVQWTGSGDLYRAYLLDAGSGEPVWPPVVLPAAAEHAAPALAADKLLIPGGRHLSLPGPLLALERADGQPVWRNDADAPYALTPAVAGDRVYAVAGRRRGFLVALALADGRCLWRAAAPRVTSRGGFTAPPTSAGERLLVPAGDFQDGKPGYALLALDLASGEVAWRYALRRHLVFAPVVAGKTAILGDGQDRLLALDLASGEPVWQADLTDRLSGPPLVRGQAVYAVTRGGHLHAVRWAASPQPPSEPPAAYEARGDWPAAAVAHALVGHRDADQAAGRCFLRAGDAAHALVLFQAAGDERGQAQALEALGRWPQAIEIYRALDEGEALARALRRAGRPGEAAPLLAELGRDLDAARAYEQAGDAEAALERYLAAAAVDEAQHLIRAGGDLQGGAEALAAANQPGAAAELYEELGRLELAAPLYAQAGRWPKAEACFRKAVARLQNLGQDGRVGEMYRAWALAEIEQRGAAARCDDALADRLEEAARHFELATRPQAADECREQAARLMEAPRFRLRIRAAEGEGFVKGESTPVRVELSNVGYGPAGQVHLQLSGDLEEPYPAQTFARLLPGEARTWETGLAPRRAGKGVRVVVKVAYRALRGGRPETVHFEHLIAVQRSRGLVGALLGESKAPVQFTIDKVIAPGATSSELTIQDSAVVSRSPLFAEGTDGAGATTASIEGSVVVGRRIEAPPAEPDSGGRRLRVQSGEDAVEVGGTGRRVCPACGELLAADHHFCQQCGKEVE